jgi:trk system potassium uptake protein TrkH
LRLHTRLVLRTSLLLFLIGFFGYLYLEPPAEGATKEFLSALFTSVTARTAGYNTVDMGMLSAPYALVIIALMFIGASPASTGGGIKTTTAAVLAVSIGNIIIGNRRIVLFRKNIPFLALNRALIVLAVSMAVVGAGVFLLTITEPGKAFLDLLFETVSAFGTVGLSRNLSPLLSRPGKLIIVATMLVGRIGILTLAFAITAPREQSQRVEYPAEQVLVG